MIKSVLLLFVLLLIGCSSKHYSSESKISDTFTTFDINDKIDNEYYLQSDICDSMRLVFLETNENSLIHAPISEIAASDNRYFLKDWYRGCGIIIFDKSGKFIKRIPQGQGPGEVFGVHGFCYDRFANHLLIVFNPYLYVFDENGEYIDSYKLPFPATSVMATEDGYIFSKGPGHKSDIENFDDYSLVITDKEFEIKGLNLKYATREPYGPSIKSDGNSIYISIADNDTIYRWEDNKLCATCSFDFSEHKMKCQDDNSSYTYEEMPDGFHYGGSFSETSTHQILSFTSKRGVCTLYRNKETNVVRGGLYSLSNTEREIVLGGIPIATYQDEFISYLMPQNYHKGYLKPELSILTPEECERLEKIGDEDNPVLVLFKLKELENVDSNEED